MNILSCGYFWQVEGSPWILRVAGGGGQGEASISTGHLLHVLRAGGGAVENFFFFKRVGRRA